MSQAGGRLPEPLLTRRLRLFPLSPSQLRLYLNDRAALARQLGLPLSQALITPNLRRAIRQKLILGQNSAGADWPWLTYWLIVIEETGFGAGMVGLKGAPDAQGDVEIGYGIDPAVRRQGYMSEAAAALIAWAFRHPTCRSVSADTRIDNLGSQRVLEKIGITHLREVGQTCYWRLEKQGN